MRDYTEASMQARQHDSCLALGQVPEEQQQLLHSSSAACLCCSCSREALSHWALRRRCTTVGMLGALNRPQGGGGAAGQPGWTHSFNCVLCSAAAPPWSCWGRSVGCRMGAALCSMAMLH